MIQVNGKTRDSLSLPVSIEQDDACAQALLRPAVRKWIDGKPVTKTIYVPERLVNFVTG
jgi:leucyl-tRNA synthetase